MVISKLKKDTFTNIFQWNKFADTELMQFAYIVQPITIIQNYSKIDSSIKSITVYYLRYKKES